jgi:hypothetical protein
MPLPQQPALLLPLLLPWPLSNSQQQCQHLLYPARQHPQPVGQPLHLPLSGRQETPVHRQQLPADRLREAKQAETAAAMLVPLTAANQAAAAADATGCLYAVAHWGMAA